eukprot:3310600-Amphidinium_carterae.1
MISDSSYDERGKTQNQCNLQLREVYYMGISVEIVFLRYADRSNGCDKIGSFVNLCLVVLLSLLKMQIHTGRMVADNMPSHVQARCYSPSQTLVDSQDLGNAKGIIVVSLAFRKIIRKIGLCTLSGFAHEYRKTSNKSLLQSS